MSLLRANIIFIAANLLHTADHQRQGTEGLSWEILAGGFCDHDRRDRVARARVATRRAGAEFGAVLGISAAAGIAASHLARTGAR